MPLVPWTQVNPSFSKLPASVMEGYHSNGQVTNAECGETNDVLGETEVYVLET